VCALSHRQVLSSIGGLGPSGQNRLSHAHATFVSLHPMCTNNMVKWSTNSDRHKVIHSPTHALVHSIIKMKNTKLVIFSKKNCYRSSRTPNYCYKLGGRRIIFIVVDIIINLQILNFHLYRYTAFIYSSLSFRSIKGVCEFLCAEKA